MTGSDLAKLSKMAEDAGFRLDAVLDDTGTRRGRKLPKVAVKFRDPANSENVWSGRGRPARWVAAYLKQGKKLEQFRVA
jgi:DNA-binding protein H-NS